MTASNLSNIEILHSISLYCNQHGDVANDSRIIAIMKALKLASINKNYTDVSPTLTEDELSKVKYYIEEISKLPNIDNSILEKITCDIDKHIRTNWVKQTFISIKKLIPFLVLLFTIIFIGQKILFPKRWNTTYFNNRELKGPAFGMYQESNPTNNWGIEAPKAGMSPNNFSIRFESEFEVKNEDTFVFNVISDDGFRLFIDNNSVMDFWMLQDSIPREARKKIPAGTHKIRLEYFEAEAGAKLEFNATNSKGKKIKFNLPKQPLE